MRELRLGVNIDHVATLRQARGTTYPDVMQAASCAFEAGAEGLTVHLREDRRHIQDADVVALCKWSRCPINLEMAVTDEMLAIATRLKPAHSCLVPEKRQELTTEGGLDVIANRERIGQACGVLAAAGIRASLFVDPDVEQLDAIIATGAPAIEIHTGAYADAQLEAEREVQLARIQAMAKAADEAGLEVHGGHGLHLDNVAAIARIPQIQELNIGHSIVAQAIFVGLGEAVSAMRDAMRGARREAAD